MDEIQKYKYKKRHIKRTEHKVTGIPEGFMRLMKRIEQEEKEKRNGKEKL